MKTTSNSANGVYGDAPKGTLCGDGQDAETMCDMSGGEVGNYGGAGYCYTTTDTDGPWGGCEYCNPSVMW